MNCKLSTHIKLLPLMVFILCSMTLPALAQENCVKELKADIADISGVQRIVSENDNFLAILDTSDRTEVIKLVSRIAAIHRQTSPSGCSFSQYPVAIVNSKLVQIKSKTTGSLTNANFIKLLYKYVYALNPVQVEENLQGYAKLVELAPQNSYYAARLDHYKERIKLQKNRNEFVSRCLKEAAKDANIVDLKIKKDIYLFILKDSAPEKTTTEFLNRVAKLTPKPQKAFCLFFYDPELNRLGESCPSTYQKTLGNAESSLLMSHVQSIPSYKIDQNINGYKALKKLNPSSTLYTTKLRTYEAKRNGLKQFLNVKTSTGSNLFTKSNVKGSTLYVTVNSDALNNNSKKSLNSFYGMLSSYYSHSGSPYLKCMIKDSAGSTLGKIQCNKKGQCSFQ
ncbi:hypothetical protein [Maridesulfovibrio frigidus]|uniref:hypothetical protein n=1 Tax=Maridesulfovibrio frigidus TaxID=340956 RepID=UPI00068DC445|nr:hypothetical protein [Maridesulfovibrio frigidus]